MNLEELREARRTERNRDGLQGLPETFYRDVASYVADLKAERERAAEAADDPFSAPEVRRLTDEIETAEEIAEALYERRVGKVVDRASLAAADKRHETEGLTAEERDLFEDLVARIERNRERVLDALDPSAGDGAAGPPAADGEVSAPDGAIARDGADGASDAPDPGDLLTEAMGNASDADGDDPGTADGPATEAESTEATDGGPLRGETGRTAPDATASDAADGAATAPSQAARSEAPAPSAAGGGAPSAPPTDGGGDDGAAAGDDTTRTTIYVTRDVGEILGVDERTYRLAAEDVVDLPADNARALVERDAAKRLE